MQAVRRLHHSRLIARPPYWIQTDPLPNWSLITIARLCRDPRGTVALLSESIRGNRCIAVWSLNGLYAYLLIAGGALLLVFPGELSSRFQI